MYDLNKIKLNFHTQSTERIENVSDEDYFGERWKDYISNSSLKLINPDEGGNPRKFLTGFKEKFNTASLELGTSVHRMVLEKDKYYVNDVEKPDGKAGNVLDRYFQLTQEGVPDEQALIQACNELDYYTKSLTQKRLDNLLESGKPYLDYLIEQSACESCITLSSEMKTRLDLCLSSLKGNTLIQDLLNPGVENYNEDVLISEVTATLASDDPMDFEDIKIDMKLKAKIDNWSVDTVNKILTLNDLKTTGGSISNFSGTIFETQGLSGEVFVKRAEGSFQKFRYYRQMAMYAHMLKSYAEEKYGFDESWTFNVNMLVVETNAPYLSHVFTVSDPWLNKGKHEFIQLVKRIAYHKVNGFDKFTDMSLDTITTI